jgi:hypothetical protein
MLLKYSYDASGNMVSQALEIVSPPQIIGQPVSQVVEPGEFATFSVVISDASGVRFQWKFNGTDIPGATGDSFLLTNVSAADKGQYSVVVANGAGSTTSASASLILATDPPSNLPLPPVLTAYGDAGGSVTVTPMKLSYDLGETVTLTATPFPPSVFVGWVGDLDDTANPASLTMDGNKTVRARFASTVPLPPGLVAFWRGETDASDLIGGHDGTFFAGASSVPPSVTPSGKVGGAFDFDGTVHVRVPDSDALKPAQITLEAWIFPHELPTDNTHQTIVARGSAAVAGQGSSPQAWYLGVLNALPEFITRHKQVFTPGQGGPPAIDIVLRLRFPRLLVGQWTHLGASFDGTNKRLYVNGAEVGAQGGLNALVYDPAALPVTIGSDSDFSASAFRFNGRVDEVAIYNRALTANEVADIYNADRLGKSVNRPYFTTPSQLPDAAVSASYTQQLTTILGTAPVSFSFSTGMLPPGMTLSATGLVSGISVLSGVFDFTVRATDAAGNFTDQLCVLRVL